MNKENEEYLFNRFSFFDRNSHSMNYGFTHGDGWFDLVNNLCLDIEAHLEEKQIKNFEVVQVKEKFGGLRFYFEGGDNVIRDMVMLAELESFHICEECGSRENVKEVEHMMWVRSLCPKCDATEDERIVAYRKKQFEKWKR